MKRLAALLVALSTLVGCSYCANREPSMATMMHRLNRSVAIVTDKGIGHGCPVGGFILTAKHVVDKVRAVNWSDQYGNAGRASLAGTSTSRDLARLRAKGMIPNALSLNAPVVGEKVYWFEYDWRTARNVMRERFRTATVLRVVANHIVLDRAPVSGASGSCLFKEGGSVVGIVIWSFTAKDKKGIGLAIRIFAEDIQ